MQTLKTAVVVVLLLAGLYGAYVVLNRPETAPSPSLAWQTDPSALEPPNIEMGGAAGLQPLGSSSPATSDSSWPVPPLAGSTSMSGGQPERQLAMVEPPIGQSSGSTDTDSNMGGANALTGSIGYPTAASSSGSLAAPAHPSAYARSGLAGRMPAAGAPDDSGAGGLNIQRNPFVDRGDPMTAARTGTAASTDTPATAAAQAARELGSIAFRKAWESAQNQIENQQWQEALFTLSIFYKSPDLSADDHDRLLGLLDPLAGKVIYSPEHLMEPAYKVRLAETLRDIGQRYNVPWQLLQKINGIDNPEVLVPGSELKVVRGPFRAEVDLEAHELTLFVGRLYAGRFPISVGNDPAPNPGDYTVLDKREDRTYFAASGHTFEAGNPQNPYGACWIDLGNELCIHASALEQDSAAGSGCISLSPIDADDVYGILSRGSRVEIRR